MSFSARLWTGCRLRFRSKPEDQIIRDGKFWLPILGIFPGNRLEEFAQLQRQDTQVKDCIWFFDIIAGHGRQWDVTGRRVLIAQHCLHTK